jgi:hypothetical protein
MRIHVVFCIGALAACSGGGGGDDEGGADAAVSATCLEATSHSDLAWIQEKVFSASCVFSSCHGGTGSMANGLVLTAGQSHDSLVNQASVSNPGMMRVVPGQPAQSYLLVAIGHISGSLPESGMMPVNSPQLCVEKREAIERWIAAGAQP